MNNDKLHEIKASLKALGVTGKIEISRFGNRATVYVKGEYFGVYDFGRHTFVD